MDQQATALVRTVRVLKPNDVQATTPGRTTNLWPVATSSAIVGTTPRVTAKLKISASRGMSANDEAWEQF
jgi:hypothetical protein